MKDNLLHIVKTRAGLLGFLSLTIIAFVFHLPFVDLEFRWAFEPDARGTIIVIREFYDAIINFDLHQLRPLLGGQTYLDGQTIFAAIFAVISKGLIELSVLPESILANNRSLFVFSFRYTSLIFLSLSVGFAFLCVRLITKNLLLSAVLTVCAFLLNPYFHCVDLLRVDHYLLFSSILLLYACFRVLEKPHTGYGLLAIAFVLNFATKLNTPLYWTFPALLVVLYFNYRVVPKKEVFRFLTVAVIMSLIFFVKWWYYPSSILPFLQSIFNEGNAWYSVLDVRPYLSHYFVHHFFSGMVEPDQSRSLIILLSSFEVAFSIISISLVVFCFSSGLWLKIKTPLPLLVITVFSIHSVGLILSPKLYRYGIHMPFYYLLFAGFAYSYLNWAGGNRRMSVVGKVLLGVFCVSGIGMNGLSYSFARTSTKNSYTAFRTVKLTPRNWLMSNIKVGSRLAVHGKERNSTPPIWRAGFDMSPQVITYNWLDSTIIYSNLPPLPDSLPKVTDVILLSNFNYYHKPRVFEAHIKWKNTGLRDSLIQDEFENEISNIDSEYVFESERFIESVLSEMWVYDCTFSEGLSRFAVAELKVDTNQAEATAALLLDRCSSFFGTELDTLDYHGLLTWSKGNLTAMAWKQFYDDLPKVFCTKEFRSEYAYYQIQWQKIIVVNESVLKNKK
ncbi:MAG: hypothetical protein K9G46_04690 [Flavobacteriales bacterium]|nr:hypothetical protein [Flavobacteriales bacterium]